MGAQQADKKSDSQTIQPPNSSSCKANTGQWIKTDNADVVNASSNIPHYIRSSINRAANKRASQVLMQKIHSEFYDVSQEFSVLKACSYYRWRRAANHTRNPPSMVTFIYFKNPLKELEKWQKQKITVLLGIDKTWDWCNSFLRDLNANSKVWWCLDPARFKKALIRCVHRGPTLNNILPRLAGMKYPALTDTSSGYDNLKLDKTIIIFNYIFLSISHVQIHTIVIWSSTSGWNVPEGDRWIL